MNEIEKLYENAGVEKQGSCPYICTTIPYHNCKVCKYKEDIHYYYPPFIAEKQLMLIKWLAFRDYITIVAYISGEYHSEHDKYNANENSLEGCLARLINNLWQDLTEEEKEQIRKILK